MLDRQVLDRFLQKVLGKVCTAGAQIGVTQVRMGNGSFIEGSVVALWARKVWNGCIII